MDMTGFDPSTMTYLATQMAHPTVGDNIDPFQDMLMPMGMPDQNSAYGYAGSEDPTHHALQPPPPQTTPSLKRFSVAYEDPFSDVVSAFEAPVNNNDTQDPETPSIEKDNKLLGFTVPSCSYALLDYTYRRTTLSLSAQLHGMFFLAESPWASAPDAQPPPSELTCYRRNLFQITGEITLPRTLRYIMTDQGEQIAIVGQELVISATESTEGNNVKIISVPWKTPANPAQPTYEDKSEREPHSIPLDLMNVQEMDSDFATFPFQWKRLQFRSATANNGRRKELQQHFVVRLKVVASLATGGKIPICEVQSGAIIVRGRSPRNFQTRKERPLNEHGRRSSHHPSRVSTGESGKTQDDNGPTSGVPQFKTETPVQNAQPEPLAYVDPNDTHLNNDLFDWRALSTPQQSALTALPVTSSPFEGVNPNSNNANGPPHYPLSSPGDYTRQLPAYQPTQHQTQQNSLPTAPINLSLVEESPSTTTPASANVPPNKTPKLSMPPRNLSFSLQPSINSPDESADLLYEYFPLGLDDWMPPVDAVYRPHVVHHTKLPTDPRDPASGGWGKGKANRGKGKVKRLYSEDPS